MKHFAATEDPIRAEASARSPRPMLSPRLFRRTPNPLAPDYLDTFYWWAYVEPGAVWLFERDWLINLILFGNYKKLGQAALDGFGTDYSGKTLQISCCYGKLTPQLAEKVAADKGTLDAIDVMPVQLDNLEKKLRPDTPATTARMDARKLEFEDAQFDRVLLFFLLHEQPAAAREEVLREALRVLKPGGRLVIVDYGKPARWHPLRYFVLPLLGFLEPFAIALWRRELTDILAEELKGTSWRQTPFYGGLYQRLVVDKA